MKTASRTRVVDKIGAKISLIAWRVASRILISGFFSRFASTFSTTKMASSTTIPMARIRPKRVRVLMENPASIIAAKVPMRETGIATAGIRVARKDWRKR